MYIIGRISTFPLTATGDINTYAVFAETIRRLLGPSGRACVILPTGIATDATCQRFFADLNEQHALASLFDFENRGHLFTDLHTKTKFCLITVSRERVAESQFAFFCQLIRHLSDPLRRFTLAPQDLELLNPNTRTCPIFRTRADAELTRKIYQRVPVLMREGGSIPIVNDFKKILRADSLLLGLALPDDNAHSPNEKFDLDCFAKGQLMAAHLWQELSKT